MYLIEVMNERLLFDIAKGSYSTNPAKEIDGFRLIRDTPTMDAYIGKNAIILGVRGTKLSDFDDIKADASLPFNRLENTNRYAKDKAFVKSVVRQYPPQMYSYYLSGHSLGGAIETQLKRDFPFMRYAVEFNPAFQPKDLTSPVPGIKRIYTSTDFLYNLGGRFFKDNVVVAPETAIGQPLVDSIKGHVLDNFRRNYYGLGTSVGIPKLGEQVQTANLPQ